MEKRLYWKELTDDGLMKEPQDVGPAYSPDSFNGWAGYESEEGAVRHLECLKKKHNYAVNGNYVLVTVYVP